METLVDVAHHRNHHQDQYYGRSRSRGPGRFGTFGSPPSGNFRGISCRTFQSGSGLLPTPKKSSNTTTAVTKKVFPKSAVSPKTPLPFVSEGRKGLKKPVKCSSMPVPIKIKFEKKEGCGLEESNLSQPWAGPAYSNSPPPSSLPIPKFSLRPKRTVSLELPSVASEINLRPTAKSAPASPTRERSVSPTNLFDGADDATMTLRRILNLDITDE